MRDKKESYQYSIKQEMQHMKFEMEQEVKIKEERIKELEEENQVKSQQVIDLKRKLTKTKRVMFKEDDDVVE